MKRKVLIALSLLALLLLMGCSDVFSPKSNPEITQDNSSRAAVGTDFLKRYGSRFGLGGQTFYFNGTNQYVFFFKNTYWVDDIINDAKSLNLNAIRTWAFCDGTAPDGNPMQIAAGIFIDEDDTTYNGVVYDSGIKKLDYAIYKCKQLGIGVILPLVNNWGDFGGMAQYLSWAGGSGTFYTNSTCKTLFKNWISHLLNRVNVYTGIAYKNEPAILMWELANEPRPGNDTVANLATWADEMASYIKSIDSNHLVCSGSEGSYASDLVTTHTSSSIDVVSIHLYPDSWAKDDAWCKAYIRNETLKAHDILGKPIILGEYGWRTRSTRAATYEGWFDAAKTYGTDGAGFWLLSSHTFDDNGVQGDLYPDYDGFTVYYPDDTDVCSTISSFSSYMASKSTTALDTTAPSITLSSPSSGAAVSGTTAISGTASDSGSGLGTVYVDYMGGYTAATGTSSWSYSWDTAKCLNGSYTLTAKAVDIQKNHATTTRSVTVSNSGAYSIGDFTVKAYYDGTDLYNCYFHPRLYNSTSGTITGKFTTRIYVTMEPNMTYEVCCDESTTSTGSLTTAGFTANGGNNLYYLEVDMGARTLAPGDKLGFRGALHHGGGGDLDTKNDWSLDSLTTTEAVCDHITFYVDGKICGGFAQAGALSSDATPGPTDAAAPTDAATAAPTDASDTPAPTEIPTATPAPTDTPAPTAIPTATPYGVTADPTTQADVTIAPTDPPATITTAPTDPPSGTTVPATCTCTNLCTSQTPVTVPLTYDGAGEYCWTSSSLASYVNSWNTDSVNVNGTNCTNTYVSSSSIAAINGVYYIYLKASYGWSHIEIK